MWLDASHCGSKHGWMDGCSWNVVNSLKNPEKPCRGWSGAAGWAGYCTLLCMSNQASPEKQNHGATLHQTGLAAENWSISVIARSKFKAFAIRSHSATWVCELSDWACEKNSITSQILKQTKGSLAYEKALMFKNADVIKNKQVASNGSLELTELGGKERSTVQKGFSVFGYSCVWVTCD